MTNFGPAAPGGSAPRSEAREQEALFRAFVTAQPDPIQVLDAQGTILVCNEATAGLFGLTAAELTGRNAFAGLAAQAAAERRARLDRVLSTKQPLQFEESIGERTYETRLVPIADPRGGAARVAVCSHDVTARQRTEKTLQETTQALGAIVRHSPLAIICTDTETNVLTWNPAAQRIFGWGEAEVLGRKNPIVPPDKGQEYDRLRESVLRGQPYYSKELRRRRKDGTTIPLNASSAALRDGQGKVIGLLGIFEDISERKLAEETLRESEEKFSKIFLHAPLLITLSAVETGRLIDVNQEFLDVSGFSREEAIGKTVLELGWISAEQRLRIVERLRETGRVAGLQITPRSKDGREITCLYSGELITLQGEQRLLTVAQDVTESTKMEKALRESESRFRATFENAAVGASFVDLAGRFLKVNRFLCEMLGYSEAELLSRTFSDVTHPDDVWIGLDYLKRQIAGEMDSASFEKRYIRKDGGVVNLIISPTLIRDEAGRPLHFIGLFQNVTERTRAQASLQQNEQFIRSILDTVDEGFIVIDRDFRILTANRAYCSQTGGSCEAILGQHCYEISHRSPQPCYERGEDCAVREVFATGRPRTASHRHTDAQGTVLFVETKAYPIRDLSGNVTSVIETIHNITEKHLLEEERLKTQKLEAIGTLAGGIAHDFNNLLQGVFGYISMAKMALDENLPSFGMLAQAEKALQLSVNLTTQLLTFSKGGKPAKKRLALQPLLENSVKFALSGSRVDCRIGLEEDLLAVEADEGQIGQVIQNIALNAVQAMPLGGTVVIGAKNVRIPGKGLPLPLAAGTYLALSFRDDGVGIPEQHLQRIFDPYFTTKERGSGLGLATSYSIVKNHGGIIDVASAIGQGTTFTVYLPAVKAHDETPEPTAPARCLRTGKVLVMDDEQVVRTIAGEMIKALGHAVDLAKNGEEVIGKYRTARESGSPFDIVILDLTIRGGLGGKETLEQLRRIDPAVKAVVSSGYADDAVMADCLKHGFSSRLAKPYDFAMLRETLGALLS